jgi:isopentenyl diphosphate isomerase/L-lactate dehydrogenase-like FMN-dependent dehydrogenase
MSSKDTSPPNAHIGRVPSDFMALHEIIQKARQKLNLEHWDYIVGATETETTLKRNRLALDTLALKPRVLRNVSMVETSIEFLGHTLNLPVMLSPVGSMEIFAAGGGATSARTAQRFGVAHMLSSVCEPGIEGVALAAPDALRLFQLYVHGDMEWVQEKIDRAVAAGVKAFCLTVDSAVYSRRERDISKRYLRRTHVPGREYQTLLDWAQVDKIRKICPLPLILKGIETAEDAALALEHGIDMVYISNHGGRQLDHGRGTMDVLPEIVETVNKKAKIIIDGGFNRGTDIVKALALGADLIGLGRMQCLGLAADGEDGLFRVLELLQQETQIAMGLLGITKISDLSPNYISKAHPVVMPTVFSAFPLLNLDEKALY